MPARERPAAHAPTPAPSAVTAVRAQGSGPTAEHPLVRLQHGRGNRYVQRLVEGSTPWSGDWSGTARAGVAGRGTSLPHLDRIQAAFGRHDLSDVRAHTGGAAVDAAARLGARAYTTGHDIAFGAAPDLRVAAHEAAHVVQQRQGARPAGGIGQVGDAYERHADRVADAVAGGRSAEGLLGPVPAGEAPAGGALQLMSLYSAGSGDIEISEITAVELLTVNRIPPEAGDEIADRMSAFTDVELTMLEDHDNRLVYGAARAHLALRAREAEFTRTRSTVLTAAERRDLSGVPLTPAERLARRAPIGAESLHLQGGSVSATLSAYAAFGSSGPRGNAVTLGGLTPTVPGSTTDVGLGTDSLEPIGTMTAGTGGLADVAAIVVAVQSAIASVQTIMAAESTPAQCKVAEGELRKSFETLAMSVTGGAVNAMAIGGQVLEKNALADAASTVSDLAPLVGIAAQFSQIVVTLVRAFDGWAVQRDVDAFRRDYSSEVAGNVLIGEFCDFAVAKGTSKFRRNMFLAANALFGLVANIASIASAGATAPAQMMSSLISLCTTLYKAGNALQKTEPGAVERTVYAQFLHFTLADESSRWILYRLLDALELSPSLVLDQGHHALTEAGLSLVMAKLESW